MKLPPLNTERDRGKQVFSQGAIYVTALMPCSDISMTRTRKNLLSIPTVQADGEVEQVYLERTTVIATAIAIAAFPWSCFINLH